MNRPGGRFISGIELPVGATKVIRFFVRQIAPHEFNWKADVRTRMPGEAFSDAMGNQNIESSEDSAHKAVSAAVSFFASCDVHLNAEQQAELEKAVVLKSVNNP